VHLKETVSERNWRGYGGNGWRWRPRFEKLRKKNGSG
jgi:hypothetical protein